MTRVDGSLARKLDFADGSASVPTPRSARRSRLRLASIGHGLRSNGPAKYRALDIRRRRAQIAARHLLDLMDTRETTR
jgi:hypothetical protein